MRSFTFGATVATLALAASVSAQSPSSSSASSSAPSSTSNMAAAASSTAIPSNISQSCSTFLVELNKDSPIKECTGPLQSAVQYYSNQASNSASSDSATSLTTSLDRLCSPTAGCSQADVKPYISNFFTQCNAEIKALNTDIIKIYDMLYLINPFREAVCTKDDNGGYCLMKVASYAAKKTTRRSLLTEDPQLLANFDRRSGAIVRDSDPVMEAELAKRQDAATVTGAAEADSSLSGRNVAFLFLQPTYDDSVLCTSCTKNILASYIRFETAIPYAIGLSNSIYLKGQSALYKASESACGKKFSSSVNSIAGTTAFVTVSGAMESAGVSLKSLLPALAAGLALVTAL